MPTNKIRNPAHNVVQKVHDKAVTVVVATVATVAGVAGVATAATSGEAAPAPEPVNPEQSQSQIVEPKAPAKKSDSEQRVLKAKVLQKKESKENKDKKENSGPKYAHYRYIDEDLLNPDFRKNLNGVLKDLDDKGAVFYVTTGFRSWEEQARLYNQGRTTPGNIVTNAKPGYSNHQYGIAADLTRDAHPKIPGLQPDWNIAQYQVLLKVANANGLESGLTWDFVDAPHMELPINDHGITTSELREAHIEGGPRAVRDILDSEDW
jgi:peptidoglycan L-alanyl-D-glutamate endopeptidase CwlK